MRWHVCSSWQPYNRNGALPEFTQAYDPEIREEDELVQVSVGVLPAQLV